MLTVGYVDLELVGYCLLTFGDKNSKLHEKRRRLKD